MFIKLMNLGKQETYFNMSHMTYFNWDSNRNMTALYGRSSNGCALLTYVAETPEKIFELISQAKSSQ